MRNYILPAIASVLIFGCSQSINPNVQSVIDARLALVDKDRSPVTFYNHVKKIDVACCPADFQLFWYSYISSWNDWDKIQRRKGFKALPSALLSLHTGNVAGVLASAESTKLDKPTRPAEEWSKLASFATDRYHCHVYSGLHDW